MNIETVNDAAFAEALSASAVVAADFTAPWCAPCKMVLPMLEELSGELGKSAAIVKVNVDDSPELASRYGIMSMPTIVIFRHGQPVDKLVGARTKEVYRQAILKHAASL